MKAVCFYFQIHQPFRLKRYRFFDIGNDHYYYDDFANDDIITRIAHQSYIPAAESLLRMIEESKGAFRCAMSISGVALEQCEQYVPEFVDLLRQLAKTGACEFLAETYDHSLASLCDPDEFRVQVGLHREKIKSLLGVTPKVLRNTELIYADELAPQILDMGFKGCITEGAKHILGWKSPNYVYSAASAPKLRLLLKNDKLSDDITDRFADTSWNEYPLTADKYISWIADTPQEEQIFNLFMNLETFGGFQQRETGIFQFLEALPRFAAERGVQFVTPSEALKLLKPVAEISIVHPISWTDEARDTSAWMGNKLQNEAISKLYSVAERVRLCDNRVLLQDWGRLQSADHFYYMSTKHFADGATHANFSPYETPYQAFTNYMNVLADFIVRVEDEYPMSVDNEELNALLTTIRNQAEEIATLQKEVNSYRTDLEHYNEEHRLRAETAAATPAPEPEKAPARKSCARKTAATAKTAAKTTAKTTSKTKKTTDSKTKGEA